MTRFTWKCTLAIAVMVSASAWAWAQKPIPRDEPTTDAELVRPRVRTKPVLAPSDAPVDVLGAGNPAEVFSSRGVNMEMVPSMPGASMRAKLVPRTVYESQMVPISESELRDMQSYQTVLETLRNERIPEDTKADSRVMLAKFVALQFDRDLESREKDVVELETRVKKLRDQFDKRKAAKDKIIELRLTTIQNEIDGLGFPGTGLGEWSTHPQPGPGFGPVQFFNDGGQLTPAPKGNLDSFSQPFEPDVKRPEPAEQAPSPSPDL